MHRSPVIIVQWFWKDRIVLVVIAFSEVTGVLAISTVLES